MGVTVNGGCKQCLEPNDNIKLDASGSFDMYGSVDDCVFLQKKAPRSRIADSSQRPTSGATLIVSHSKG
jgi:hypothetical protein